MVRSEHRPGVRFVRRDREPRSPSGDRSELQHGIGLPRTCQPRPAPPPRAGLSFPIDVSFAPPSASIVRRHQHAGRRSSSHVHQDHSTRSTPPRTRPCPGSASPGASRSCRGPCRSRAVRSSRRRNLSNLPFAIDHVALMPDAHTGYGMPIGGVLFADKAVVPYAIGVDIGCGVALVETDLTVETLSTGRPWTGARRRSPPGVPTGIEGQAPRSTARPPWPRSGCRVPESVKERLVRARRRPAGHAGWWQPLPGGPAGRGRAGAGDAPLGLAEPGQDDLRRVPQAGARAEPALARPSCRTPSWPTCRWARTASPATGRR